ncbi:calcium-translocating P-type ATPase, PMCA-type [Dysgonomonas sp. Marseille-P4677]|uniref:calcium-translocating P-type ATPase, PMCA-type n=1 Tax=Dysgonomonas sp. Marseille-P4677 TaxID=2364790 RepID=UPI0019136C72|nr:calcium-translocating P-type ATPase, PMCA-type [Dysgonomonas sp. Marseille-P4677]MBK5719661.1 calcium-translocating P-type ATPase, PMCA-type [Dysgonomonas sp. Marseille-P4677]
MEGKKNYSGLTDSQVKESRKKYGQNVLTPPKKEPLWKLFLKKFDDPIIRILLIAAFLSLGISIIHNEYIETIGIFCAILLATGVSFWFEMDANKKFDILNQVNDEDMVTVMRNGNIKQVPKKDIVVGDVVFLEMGNEVPADGELLDAVSMQIDESCLTGELSIDKTIDPDHFEEGVTYPSNWVLRGTKVINGHGVFEVARVGDASEFGKVAEKATEKVEGETPLNRQLDSLAKFIGVIGLILAILTFSVLFVKDTFLNPDVSVTLGQLGLLGAVMIGLAIAMVKVWLPIIYDGIELTGKDIKLPKSVKNGSWLKWFLIGSLVAVVLASSGFIFGVNPFDVNSWISIDIAASILQAFMVAVTLVVVAVPEGLPMSVTLSLALSMRRMLKMNNLVRKMHAVETMGATTVICTDKTGTLTQNQMQVASTNFYGIEDQILTDSEISRLVIGNISVNSTAFLDLSHPEKVESLGNPTEGALLLWLNKNKILYSNIRGKEELLDQLPFSTERKFMATLVDSPKLKRKVLYVKGAPEVVFSKCKVVATEEGNISADQFKERVNDQLLQYQNQAMRTLGFAYKYIDDEGDSSVEELVSDDLIFLGIAGISDPVRPDVPDAVKRCLNAGVGVKIVTGDTFGTAKEIGRQIGIWSDDEDTDLNIIGGVDFEALSDEEALSRVKDLKIMCRARPTDKQRLVHLLKQRGEIVAVTGDGTNDAPALNYADVGLSMGSGTSVAKEASDITLLDDSFSSIATAVMWGRSLYKNIQRFILFQLTINVAALLIVFLGSIFGHELPLTVTQMLWVNLIMDTFAAGALASLPPDPNVMNSKPRKNTDFIITKSIAKHILITGILFVILLLSMMYYFSAPEHLNSFFSYIDEADREGYFLSYFFTVFVLLQFWNMFNAKAYATGKSAFSGLKESAGFELVALIILAGQIIIVTFGGEVFRTMPLTIQDWGIIIGGTSVVLWIGEIIRLVKRR